MSKKGTEAMATALLGLQMHCMTIELEGILKELEDPEGYVGNTAALYQAINTLMKQNNIQVTADDKRMSSLQSLLVKDGAKKATDFDVTLDIHKH